MWSNSVNFHSIGRFSGDYSVCAKAIYCHEGFYIKEIRLILLNNRNIANSTENNRVRQIDNRAPLYLRLLTPFFGHLDTCDSRYDL
jgi:hypothetical protein